MSRTTPHPAPPKPTWRLRCICIQIRSFCITSGANYGAQMGEITSRLWGAIGRTTLTQPKNGNPIQRREEEQIIPLFLSPLSSLGVSDVSFPFHASLFLMCADRCFCACGAWIFLITHLSRNQDKYTETSCHGDNVHTQQSLTVRLEVCIPEALS